ncbi:MAG: hypothetical protein ACRD2L_23770, partial [Terriglobia bacterium]
QQQTELPEAPENGNDDENTWVAKCIESASKNPNIEKADCLCRLAYRKVAKANGGIIKLSVEEIRKDNPKLAKCMEDDGHASLSFETQPKEDDIQKDPEAEEEKKAEGEK